MTKEHECKRQIYRVAEYDVISGGGWFVDANREKVDILFCPYCGTKLT